MYIAPVAELFDGHGTGPACEGHINIDIANKLLTCRAWELVQLGMLHWIGSNRFVDQNLMCCDHIQPILRCC